MGILVVVYDNISWFSGWKVGNLICFSCVLKIFSVYCGRPSCDWLMAYLRNVIMV